MSLVGKYVCYGNESGGFCWGKIKAEVKINTMDGWVDGLVLSEWKTCIGPPYTVGRIESRNRDAVIEKRKINAETDIVESRDMFGELTDDELFVMLMQGGVNRKVSSFISNLAKSRDDGVTAMVKETLEKRMAGGV